jgi:hypothetical protein
MERHPMGRCRRRRLLGRLEAVVDHAEGLALARGRGDPAAMKRQADLDRAAESLAEYLTALLCRRKGA